MYTNTDVANLFKAISCNSDVGFCELACGQESISYDQKKLSAGLVHVLVTAENKESTTDLSAIKSLLQEARKKENKKKQTFVFTLLNQKKTHFSVVAVNTDGESCIVNSIAEVKFELESTCLSAVSAAGFTLPDDKQIVIKPEDNKSDLHQKDNVSCGAIAFAVAAVISNQKSLQNQQKDIESALIQAVDSTEVLKKQQRNLIEGFTSQDDQSKKINQAKKEYVKEFKLAEEMLPTEKKLQHTLSPVKQSLHKNPQPSKNNRRSVIAKKGLFKVKKDTFIKAVTKKLQSCVQQIAITASIKKQQKKEQVKTIEITQSSKDKPKLQIEVTDNTLSTHNENCQELSYQVMAIYFKEYYAALENKQLPVVTFQAIKEDDAALMASALLDKGLLPSWEQHETADFFKLLKKDDRVRFKDLLEQYNNENFDLKNIIEALDNFEADQKTNTMRLG
ncbi:MAG: hypothetical protein CMF49_05855 [Legionellales bacterium]|nr:hypothetical protein [Legionellales bacterium]